MLEAITDSLIDLENRVSTVEARILWGQVTSFSGGVLRVRLAGDATGDVPVALQTNGKVWKVGDKVPLVRFGTQLVALGGELVAPSAATGGSAGLDHVKTAPFAYAAGQWQGAPTGYHSLSTTSTNGVDRLYITPYTNGPIQRTYTAIGAGNYSTTGVVKMGVYNADGTGGAPGSLITGTAVTGSNSTYSTNTFTQNLVLEPFQTVWLAQLLPSGNMWYYQSANFQVIGGNLYSSLSNAISNSSPVRPWGSGVTYAGGMPSTFPTTFSVDTSQGWLTMALRYQ